MMNGETERAALTVTGIAGVLAGAIAGLQSTVRADAIVAVLVIVVLATGVVVRLFRAS